MLTFSCASRAHCIMAIRLNRYNDSKQVFLHQIHVHLVNVNVLVALTQTLIFRSQLLSMQMNLNVSLFLHTH